MREHQITILLCGLAGDIERAVQRNQHPAYLLSFRAYEKPHVIE